MTRPVDDTPLSDFVQKMREAYLRRRVATSVAEKRAAERDIEALIRANDSQAGTASDEASVPRDTSSVRSCHTLGGQSVDTARFVDWKQRSAKDFDFDE